MLRNNINFTEGSITKSIVLFAVPLMLSNLFQQLYSTVDSAVIGRFAGSLALAGVGSAMPLINLLLGFFLGISTGTGVVYATACGAGSTTAQRRITDTALMLAAAAGAVLTLFGVAFAPWLLRLMNTAEDALPGAVTYLRIYLGGVIIMLVYNVGAGILRARGDSRSPLIYLFVSGVLNLILDVIFVALLNLGIAGAAAATVISQAAAAALVLRALASKLPQECRLLLRDMHWDSDCAKSIIRIALPSGLQTAFFSLSNLIAQTRINTFGSVTVAGCTAYIKLDSFCYLPMMATAQALTTFVSQNLGAGKPERMRSGLRFCLILAPAVSALCCIITFLLREPLLYLFTDDPAVVEAGLSMLLVLVPFTWIYAFSDMFGSAMRGAGAAKPVTVISAICVCLVRIVWMSVVLHFFDSVGAVFACYPFTWILSSLVMGLYYRSGRWKNYSKIAVLAD